MKNSLKITILTKVWVIHFYAQDKFKRYHGKNALAMTLPHLKKIVFDADFITKETIIHELVHAYFDEGCIGVAIGLSKKQLDEAYCELFSKYHKQLLQHQRVISKFSNKLKKSLK